MKMIRQSKKKISLLIILAALSVLLGYLPMRQLLSASRAEVQELKTVVEKTESQLLGHTQYTSYITVGKQSLAGQMKLLTATVVREEGVTQLVERTLLPGISSSGTVAIWYQVEYAFGFDLQADQYDIKSLPTGIEVHIRKPTLVATPAITKLKYKVLSGGLLTDEKAAALELYAQAATRAKTQGIAMASEAPVLALCEKKLIEFLHGFLAKQPGVKVVPHITVIYE
jgi:hypothetical protein